MGKRSKTKKQKTKATILTSEQTHAQFNVVKNKDHDIIFYRQGQLTKKLTIVKKLEFNIEACKYLKVKLEFKNKGILLSFFDNVKFTQKINSKTVGFNYTLK